MCPIVNEFCAVPYVVVCWRGLRALTITFSHSPKRYDQPRVRQTWTNCWRAPIGKHYYRNARLNNGTVLHGRQKIFPARLVPLAKTGERTTRRGALHACCQSCSLSFWGCHRHHSIGKALSVRWQGDQLITQRRTCANHEQQDVINEVFGCPSCYLPGFGCCIRSTLTVCHNLDMRILL